MKRPGKLTAGSFEIRFAFVKRPLRSSATCDAVAKGLTPPAVRDIEALAGQPVREVFVLRLFALALLVSCSTPGNFPRVDESPDFAGAAPGSDLSYTPPSTDMAGAQVSNDMAMNTCKAPTGTTCPPTAGNCMGIGKPCTVGGNECKADGNVCDKDMSPKGVGICITIGKCSTGTCGTGASCCKSAQSFMIPICLPNLCLPSDCTPDQ
jgi:hypothetical protein